MVSFYAKLTADGQAYPVRECQFSFNQAVAERGRVQAKVCHNLLHLTLDVPTDDALLAWAGHVTFFAADRQTAHETVHFAASLELLLGAVAVLRGAHSCPFPMPAGQYYSTTMAGSMTFCPYCFCW